MWRYLYSTRSLLHHLENYLNFNEHIRIINLKPLLVLFYFHSKCNYTTDMVLTICYEIFQEIRRFIKLKFYNLYAMYVKMMFVSRMEES